MATGGPRETQWPLIAEDWLIAKLKANAGESEMSVWDAQLLTKVAEQTLDITKSKRSWERFLADLPFLQVITAPDELQDDIGRPARSIVIGELINGAQQERRPVYFLAIHHLDDLSIAVTSTTKGRKTWLGFPKSHLMSNGYVEILDRIAEKDALIIPNGDAVGWLREAQRKLGAKPSTMQSRSPSNPWFDALTGFHEHPGEVDGPSARRGKRAKTSSTIELRELKPALMTP